MKKIFAALMIAAAIAAFALPKAQTYAAESADDYVAVKMESDCENFTFSGFSVIPNDNASKYAHIGSYEKGSVFSGGFTGGKITFYGWKGGEGGRIKVEIDGEDKGEFSLADDNDEYGVPVAEISGLDKGSHQFEVTTLDDKWTAIDYVEFEVERDVYNYSFNLAQCAEIITSVPNPTGGGAKDLNVVRDESFVQSGVIGGYNSPGGISYDSFTGAGENVFYMGYRFPFEVYVAKFVYREGSAYHDGGWFAEKPRVEVMKGGTWQQVTPDNDPYPDNAENGAGFRTFVYTFDPVRCTGIRIAGKAGGEGNFVSVSQLEAYGRKDVVSFSEGADYRDAVSLVSHEHEFAQDDQGVKVPATCITAGYTEKICLVCGLAVKTEVTSPAGHSYQTTVVPPSCTEEGYTLRVCTVCGYSEKSGITPAAGHVFGEWQIDEPATCTENGTEKRVCTVCGKKESRTLSARGHEYEQTVVAPSCTEEGYTLHKCAVCGDEYRDGVTPAAGHKWDDGEITLQPTVQQAGEKTFTCLECGAVKTETVAKLPDSGASSGCGGCEGKAARGYEALLLPLTAALLAAAVLRRKL